MQKNSKNKEKILCPRITCLVFLGLSILGFFFNLSSPNLANIISILITITIYAAIFSYISTGIYDKDISIYFRGLLISLIYSIVITIFDIILIIIIIIYKPKKENKSFEKRLNFIILILTFLFAWLLTLIIFLYKKKVQKLCKPPSKIPNLINNNDPLVQPNNDIIA